MATKPKRVVLTYEDYCALPDDGKRYEILEGELEVTPAPGVGHQIGVTMLATILVTHVERHNLGKVLVAPCDVLLSDITIVQPDLLYVSRERYNIITPANVQGPPDLVVEVLSPTTEARDRGVKMQLYARYGVPHYWLMDTGGRELRAFTLVQDRYDESAVARGSEQFKAAPFPDLPIPLGQLWSSPA